MVQQGLWHLTTGKKAKHSPLRGHTGNVNSVAISHDNQYIVSGSEDNTIRIWDFNTGKQVNYSPLLDHTSWVNSVAISKDNKYIVSASDDKTIRIWDLKLLAYVYGNNKQEEEKIDECKNDSGISKEVFDID